MKTLTATLCGVLLTAGTVALLPATAEAAVLCHGRAATMIASGSGVFTATEGDDVIVADGGRLRIRALGGDDVVCLHDIRAVVGGRGRRGRRPRRRDGHATHPTVASLGVGLDTFRGRTGRRLRVRVGARGLGEDGLNPPDTETDVITTGGGNDQVFSGALGSANLDVIATGAGDDRVHLEGLDHATSLDVGAGRNTAIVTLGTVHTTAWSVDLGRRTLGFDGQTSTWGGRLHRWYLTHGRRAGPLVAGVLRYRRPTTRPSSADPASSPQFRLGTATHWAGSLTTPGVQFLRSAPA